MWTRLPWLGMVCALPLLSQQVCPPTPAYTPCDIVFELNDEEAAAHPNPYVSVELRAEFRSPRARTLLMHGFWRGGRQMVIRFSPTEPGAWDFRISGNLARFNGKLGQVEATPSEDPGFLAPANVHHWRTGENRKQHLWMGDTWLGFAQAPQPAFDAYLEARAKQKFSHIRGLIVDEEGRAFPSGAPDPAFLDQLDKRVEAFNRKGMFTDLILVGSAAQAAKLLPGWAERERFVRYLMARYSAFHVTWQLLGQFEDSFEGRALLKELGGLVKKYDPYNHPRSTGTQMTSSPVTPDGWQNFVTHHSPEDALGAIEHQVFPVPFVNTGFSQPQMDPAEFVRRLWNATMNGQYPSSTLDAAAPESASAKTMGYWFEFMQRTRYWELEPYFDVEGGRCVALPGVEYIVYIEKWGTVELLIEKHGYDVFWFNPATGETVKEKKDFKGEKWVGEPPSKTGEWVLHLSREGRKEGMLRSYKFESRPNLMQEIEQNPQKMPFEVLSPGSEQLSVLKPSRYEVKVKRETRGSRSMMYLWTGEVPTEGRGFRVIGVGSEGTLRLPSNLAKSYPAVFNLRIYALNAVGKAYALDKVYRLSE